MPIFTDQRFNDTLTNDIVSFEKLGPEYYSSMSVFDNPSGSEILNLMCIGGCVVYPLGTYGRCQ